MEEDIGEIQPKELRFMFEPKKRISCILMLVNNSNRHMAFKVKITRPKVYQVEPHEGIVKPFSICEVTITRRGENVVPLPNVIEKEIFLVQRTFVPEDTSANDVSSVFRSKGIVKSEKKLKVYVYVKPMTEAQQIKLMQSKIEELRLRVKKCEKNQNQRNRRVVPDKNKLEPVYGLLTEAVAYKGYFGFLMVSANKGTVWDCLLNCRAKKGTVSDCLRKMLPLYKQRS
ncbi:vesicle-associated protein 1-2-like protein [Tanacetum coccineum]